MLSKNGFEDRISIQATSARRHRTSKRWNSIVRTSTSCRGILITNARRVAPHQIRILELCRLRNPLPSGYRNAASLRDSQEWCPGRTKMSHFRFIVLQAVETAPRRRLDINELHLERYLVCNGSFVSSATMYGAALTSRRSQADRCRRVLAAAPVRRQGGPVVDHSVATIIDFNSSVTTAITPFFVIVSSAQL